MKSSGRYVQVYGRQHVFGAGHPLSSTKGLPWSGPSAEFEGLPLWSGPPAEFTRMGMYEAGHPLSSN